MRKRVLVVGSGAGGATVAKVLQGPFQVTVLEAGRSFQRLKLNVAAVERLHRTGLPIDPRLIRFAYPAMRVRKTEDMLLVNGVGVGGTTTVATANGVRMDHDLRVLGIDLDDEFAQAYAEIPVTTAHQAAWRASTRQLFDIATQMGLEPKPMPKMGHADRCVHCGRCVLGCPTGAKWDSRQFVDLALRQGAELRTGYFVERILIEDGRVTGVMARAGWRRHVYPADVVVLAAGGLGTPVILDRSGIRCEPTLFVDPVLCVAGVVPEVNAIHEVSMPFVVQRDRYIISPYFDYLSFLSQPDWRRRAADIVSVMIKLADDNRGTIEHGRVRKTLSDDDRLRLAQAVKVATEMLARLGVPEGKTFLGLVNGGHPGGMLPLTEAEAASFHHDRLPSNLYVADSSLLPKALGNPPILTIVAMALRAGRLITERFVN